MPRLGERELATVKFKVSKELKEAHDEKSALEDRIRKALNPYLEEDEEEEDNSPSPSFAD